MPSIFLPCASPAIVWFTTATSTDDATSSILAPWLMMGWISDLAKTPQRDAIVYICVDCSLSLSISSRLMPRSVAIWSMNAPVPPAHVPFILTSSPFFRKRIFASSPPSSIIVSVSGMKVFAATLVAYTSWTNGMPAASASPIPAEPESAMVTSSSPMASIML